MIQLLLLFLVVLAFVTNSASDGMERRLLSNSTKGDSRRNLGQCLDASYGHCDSWGDCCREYQYNKYWCGHYDTSNFDSRKMCCACGGGKKKNSYKYVSRETGSCLDVGSYIDNEEECRMAARQIGWPVDNGKYQIGNTGHWPPGCWLNFVGQEVAFNTRSHSSEPCQDIDVCLCRSYEYVSRVTGSCLDVGSYIDNEEECRRAARRIGWPVDNGKYKVGNQGDWPPGCWLNFVGQVVVFNTRSHSSEPCQDIDVCLCRRN